MESLSGEERASRRCMQPCGRGQLHFSGTMGGRSREALPPCPAIQSGLCPDLLWQEPRRLPGGPE